MLLTTTEHVPDGEVTAVLGVVQGNTVRARNVGRDITQGLRNLVGGEVPSYTPLLTDASEETLGRLEAEATDLGADEVVNVRFQTSEIAQMRPNCSPRGPPSRSTSPAGGRPDRPRLPA